jgi:hypothetical protein
MASLKSNPVVKKLMETGEAQVGKVVQQVLSNEKFVTTVQAVVQTTLQAKGTFDKSVQAALSAMNLPTREDVEGLQAKVADLEALLTRLDEKVSRLVEEPKKEKAEKKSKNASA